MTGGYIYDTDNNEWIKIGEWKQFDNTGTLIETKIYKWGIESSK